jgi:phosphoglycolate phosphatase-like HAD superfamily hydrolase
MSRKVLLFDIDGTLIRCGGAGGKSLCAALAEEFGLAEVHPVALHGRTDLGILNELLSNHGIECTEANRNRLCERYFQLLPHQLNQLASNSAAHVLPGVTSLLQQLSQSSSFLMALLTGNMPTSAQIKLEHFELWSYFEFGVFGNLVDHRPLLAEPAKTVIEQHCGSEIAADQLVIIGDTPLDIELARAMGARCLAVCTGGFSLAELEQAGAEIVLEDLSDTPRIVDWLEQTLAW